MLVVQAFLLPETSLAHLTIAIIIVIEHHAMPFHTPPSAYDLDIYHTVIQLRRDGNGNDKWQGHHLPLL